MAEDWYRNKSWSAEIEEEFFRKLKCCRSQGPQNLVFQASTLARIEPAVAMRLVFCYFDTPTKSAEFSRNTAFCACAEALETLGRLEEAVEAYRDALNWEKLRSGHISTAWGTCCI